MKKLSWKLIILARIKWLAIALTSTTAIGLSLPDCATADDIALLQKLASTGDATSQFELGREYEEGIDVPKDYAQAVAWYRKAANQGNVDAQKQLAWGYSTGIIVQQDYAQANAWCRKAADQGDAGAQDTMGWHYQKGLGVPRDYAQAVAWYRRAADQGNAGGLINLGLMYEKGKYVQQNNVITYALYNLATTGDDLDLGAYHRDHFMKEMSEHEIELGQALSQKMQSMGVTKAIDAYLK